jgi:hypothetical protein
MTKHLLPSNNNGSRSIVLIIIFIALLPSLYGQPFKTVGYLPYYRFGAVELIAYEKLTHLNIAFGYPDEAGNISVGGQDITQVVSLAQAQEVEVFLSIAGGSAAIQQNWVNLLQPQNRSAFIQKLVGFTVAHNLQGIDVDLEWGDVTENYSGFVLELKDSMNVYNLTMTAALPGSYRYPNLSNEALEAFEWINMMVYDHAGPWAPNSPGQHSPYSKAVDAIAYWSITQGVPTEKLTLGVPFYGYDFNDPGDVHSFTYASVVAQDTENADLDQVGLAFYNGRPTIEAKTNLALENLSGIMIWELGQDAFLSIAEYSLLETIYQTIQAYFVSTEEAALALTLNAYPNPFDNQLHVEHSGTARVLAQLSNIHGAVLWRQEISADQKTLDITTDRLPGGFYILSMSDGKNIVTRKVIKH